MTQCIILSPHLLHALSPSISWNFSCNIYSRKITSLLSNFVFMRQRCFFFFFIFLNLSRLPLCPFPASSSFQEILGGPYAAEQKYDAEFFKTFRSQNIVLSARNYARVTPDFHRFLNCSLNCLPLLVSSFWLHASPCWGSETTAVRSLHTLISGMNATLIWGFKLFFLGPFFLSG